MPEPIRIEADERPRDDFVPRETSLASIESDSVDGPARVAAAFADARAEERAALVIYLPANYPDPETSLDCFRAAIEAGADVVEVGFPFSDPMMDGPTIQAANQHVLDAGHTVADHLALVTALTSEVDTPALCMTYVTIADTRGYERFAEECAAAGLAGVILPDLPASEGDDWRAAAAPHDLATVFLASSVSTDERLDTIADAATGFVYAAGLLGVTGVDAVDQGDSRALVERLRARTDLPVAVGIGVRTADDARAVAGYADGVIVGSAVVRAIADGDAAGAPDRVRALVAELRAGCEA
jgi:tryptophan synthase alpha chain